MAGDMNVSMSPEETALRTYDQCHTMAIRAYKRMLQDNRPSAID